MVSVQVTQALQVSERSWVSYSVQRDSTEWVPVGDGLIGFIL